MFIIFVYFINKPARVLVPKGPSHGDKRPPMHGRSQGRGGKYRRSPPTSGNSQFLLLFGGFFATFSPFGGLHAMFLIFMWGLFYHAACGGLLAIFISMHMGSFSNFFSMCSFFIVGGGGGFLCSYGGLFWACPPPLQTFVQASVP